jgi:uncharacterized membrane protein YkoI
MLLLTRTGLILILLSFGASARDLSQDEALRLREQGLIVPLEQVLTLVDARYPDASLLEVELEEEEGVYIYEVELATKTGLVRELEIDATSGKILQDEADD